MKSSFSILEMFLSIIISTTIIIYANIFLRELLYKNQKTLDFESYKLELISAKIILEKNSKDLSGLKLNQNILFFKNSPLLKDVKNFSLSVNSDFATINLTIKDDIMLSWNIKLWKKHTLCL